MSGRLRDEVVERFVRPWSRRQVADYLGCSVWQVKQDTDCGFLEGTCIGHRWYYDPRKVMRAIGLDDPRDWDIPER